MRCGCRKTGDERRSSVHFRPGQAVASSPVPSTTLYPPEAEGWAFTPKFMRQPGFSLPFQYQKGAMT